MESAESYLRRLVLVTMNDSLERVRVLILVSTGMEAPLSVELRQFCVHSSSASAQWTRGQLLISFISARPRVTVFTGWHLLFGCPYVGYFENPLPVSRLPCQVLGTTGLQLNFFFFSLRRTLRSFQCPLLTSGNYTQSGTNHCRRGIGPVQSVQGQDFDFISSSLAVRHE